MEIYLVYSEVLNLYKIGVSKSPERRLAELQTVSPYKLELLHTFKTNFSFKMEAAVHNSFSAYKKDLDNKELEGEWFGLLQEHVDGFVERCQTIENNFKVLKEANNPFF
jgi:hypothetical protein